MDSLDFNREEKERNPHSQFYGIAEQSDMEEWLQDSEPPEIEEDQINYFE